VEAATDGATVVRLCSTVAPDYRVYLVVLPQTHLTIGGDRAQAGAELGDTVIDTFDDAIAAAADAGADVADSVLSVTPASYNTGSGETVLDGARVHLRNAHSELHAAAADGAAAAKALRAALGDLA
jgi:hypothetical protein